MIQCQCYVCMTNPIVQFNVGYDYLHWLYQKCYLFGVMTLLVVNLGI